jgi:hypothetical protein
MIRPKIGLVLFVLMLILLFGCTNSVNKDQKRIQQTHKELLMESNHPVNGQQDPSQIKQTMDEFYNRAHNIDLPVEYTATFSFLSSSPDQETIDVECKTDCLIRNVLFEVRGGKISSADRLNYIKDSYGEKYSKHIYDESRNESLAISDVWHWTAKDVSNFALNIADSYNSWNITSAMLFNDCYEIIATEAPSFFTREAEVKVCFENDVLTKFVYKKGSRDLTVWKLISTS